MDQCKSFTEENKKQFYISEGFAHGFLVLSDTAEFCYKCTDFYHPGDESGLAWNDQKIGIEWPDLVGEYEGKYADKKKLADEAIYLERELYQEAGGWQDQIAASFGGFNRINFTDEG